MLLLVLKLGALKGHVERTNAYFLQLYSKPVSVTSHMVLAQQPTIYEANP